MSLRQPMNRLSSRTAPSKADSVAICAAVRSAARAAVETLEDRRLFAIDLFPPSVAGISAPDINGSPATFQVSVHYLDDGGLDTSTIDTNDLSVSGPAGNLQVLSVDTSGNANDLTATYTVAAPSGGFTADNDGNYTAQVLDNQVFDAIGNSAGGSSKNFSVTVDSQAPTASIAVGGISAAAASTTITVTYSDNDAINAGSIDVGDLVVTGPGGSTLSVTGVNVSGSGSEVVAVYTVAAPGGSWDAADNGSYSVNVLEGSVVDATGNGVGAKSRNFDLLLDGTGPSTSINAADLNAVPGATGYRITVTYADDNGIDVSTIGPSDIVVTGPNGPVSVASFDVTASNGGKRQTVRYTLAAPGGDWDQSDNGQYTVDVVDGAVADSIGNRNAVDTDSFNVNIPAPDTTAPLATIANADLSAVKTNHTVKITYTDDRGIDASTIGKDDITVSGPGGAVTVSAASADSQDNGRKYVVTYTLKGPGGDWDSLDNGTYTITLAANAVTDTAGLGIVGETKDFTVNILAPDVSAPSATIGVADVTAPGGATHTITVTYTDDRAVKASTVGTGDIRVTGPGGTLQVLDATPTPTSNNASITVTYTVAAPGGVWDPTDNGTYTVEVINDEVTDTNGNGVTGVSKTFNVTAGVSDSAPPSATIGANDVTTAGATSGTVVVTYVDDAAVDSDSIGADDITITGPAGSLPISTVVINSSDNGHSVVATYTFGAPTGGWNYTHNGTYTVTVNSDAVRDLSGKGVAAVNGTFRVAAPAPQPVDTSFGGGSGNVNTTFVGESVATQADGMILVAGRIGDVSGGHAQAVLSRLNGAGGVDTTFGTNGRVTTTGGNEAFFTVLRQGDKILVAGTSNGDFLLSRYDSAGNLDTTFAGGGRMITDLGAVDDAIYGMALAPDGKIVVTGGSGGNFAFARFSADGTPDITFDQGGKTLFDLGTDTDIPGAVAVQADGKIVAVGSSGANVAVVRLRSDGLPDTSFSGDGLVMVSGMVARQEANFTDRSQALAIQSDGKLLIANHTLAGDNAVARLDGGGNLDGSFGTGGIATVDFAGDDDADAIIIQNTGEIMVIGTSAQGGTARTTIAALNNSGQLIEGFGQGGKLVFDALPAGAERELHVGDLVVRSFGTKQDDGRIVVGTSNQAPGGTTSALKRLIVPGSVSAPSGSLLGNFGTVNGKNARFVYDAGGGKFITFTMKGGTGSVYQNGDSVNLVINDDGKGAAVAVKVKGGDGRAKLGDIAVNGSLKSFAAKTGDLSGTMSVGIVIGKVLLGDVTGVIAAGGGITSIAAANLTGARILAGTGLGADRVLGGTAADADTFAGGTIGKLTVKGAITSSLIGAGLNPTDGTYGDDDDTVVGGAASFIKSIAAKGGADDATRFVAGSFGKAKLGKDKLDLATDVRFKTLA